MIYHLTLICLGGHDFMFGDISFNIVWVGSGGCWVSGRCFSACWSVGVAVAWAFSGFGAYYMHQIMIFIWVIYHLT